MSLSIGKLRRLQQCSTPDSMFVIMALDHRHNLRASLNPNNPDSITYNEMVLFKQEIIRALAPTSSAILLDPEFGAAQSVAGGSLTGATGLMVCLEEKGYSANPHARQTDLLEDWSVEQSARMGASAVKLMLYYHPEAKNAAEQEKLVSRLAEECRQYDMPFFLQPLSYSLDAKSTRLSSAEKRRVVIESARRLSPLGIDVLKAEFPLDIEEESNPIAWQSSCRALTDASEVPWVLLSGGAPFDVFLRQTEVACKAGCSGVMAGRAVWQEAVTLRGDKQTEFLYKTAIDRLVDLGDVISEFGLPWTEHYQSAVEDVGADWYRNY